jgi:hypothetical protein
MHPQLVSYDTLKGTANVGLNLIQTCARREKVEWYAGTLDVRRDRRFGQARSTFTATPVEFGPINLTAREASSSTRPASGLIVEPPGSRAGREFQNLRKRPEGDKLLFRELVVVMQDDVAMVSGKNGGVPAPYLTSDGSPGRSTPSRST